MMHMMADCRQNGELHHVGTLSQGLKGNPMLQPIGLSAAFQGLGVTETRLERESYQRLQGRGRHQAPGVVDASRLIRTADDTILHIRAPMHDLSDVSSYHCLPVDTRNRGPQPGDPPMIRQARGKVAPSSSANKDRKQEGPHGKLVKASLARDIAKATNFRPRRISVVSIKTGPSPENFSTDDNNKNRTNTVPLVVQAQSRHKHRSAIVVPHAARFSPFDQDEYEVYARSPSPPMQRKTRSRDRKNRKSGPSFLPKVSVDGPTNMVSREATAWEGGALPKHNPLGGNADSGHQSGLVNTHDPQGTRVQDSFHRRKEYGKDLERSWVKNTLQDFHKKKQDKAFVSWFRQNFNGDVDDFYKAFFSSGEDEKVDLKESGVRGSTPRSRKSSARSQYSSRSTKSSGKGRQGSARSSRGRHKSPKCSSRGRHRSPDQASRGRIASPENLLHYASTDVLAMSDGELADQSGTDVETVLLSGDLEERHTTHKMRRKRHRQEVRYRGQRGSDQDVDLDEEVGIPDDMTDAELRQMRLKLPQTKQPEVYMPPELSLDPAEIRRALAAIISSNKPRPRRRKPKKTRRRVHWNATQNQVFSNDTAPGEGYYLRQRFYAEYGFLVDDGLPSFPSDSDEEDTGINRHVANQDEPRAMTTAGATTVPTTTGCEHQVEPPERPEGEDPKHCKMKRFMSKYGVDLPIESFLSVPGTNLENTQTKTHPPDAQQPDTKPHWPNMKRVVEKISCLNAFKTASPDTLSKPNSVYVTKNGDTESFPVRPRSCPFSAAPDTEDGARPKSACLIPSPSVSAGQQGLHSSHQSRRSSVRWGEVPHIYLHQGAIVVRPHPLASRRHSAAAGMCWETLLHYQRQQQLLQQEARKLRMRSRKNKRKKRRKMAPSKQSGKQSLTGSRTSSPSRGRESRASSQADTDTEDLFVDKAQLRRTLSARAFHPEKDKDIDLHQLTDGYEFPAKEVKLQIAERRHKRALRRVSQRSPVRDAQPPAQGHLSCWNTTEPVHDNKTHDNSDTDVHTTRHKQWENPGVGHERALVSAGVAWNRKRERRQVQISKDEIEAELPRLGALFLEMRACRYIRWSRRDQAILDHLDQQEWAGLRTLLGY